MWTAFHTQPASFRTIPISRTFRSQCMVSCCQEPRIGQEQESYDTALSRRNLLSGLAAAATTTVTPEICQAATNGRIGAVAFSEDEWKNKLSHESYRVLREAGTEKRFSSPLVQEKRVGVFCCAGCGAQLFSSEAKYESGTGWPSFYQAIEGAVELDLDNSLLFMPRTEVRCKQCQGHLGHVFNDGPQPTGLRYCMNGAAMLFQPAKA